jgi:hypothetical protein
MKIITRIIIIFPGPQKIIFTEIMHRRQPSSNFKVADENQSYDETPKNGYFSFFLHFSHNIKIEIYKIS